MHTDLLIHKFINCMESFSKMSNLVLMFQHYQCTYYKIVLNGYSYVWLSMVIYDYVWLFMVMWLCMVMHGYMVIYGMYGYVWYVWLYTMMEPHIKGLKPLKAFIHEATCC